MSEYDLITYAEDGAWNEGCHVPIGDHRELNLTSQPQPCNGMSGGPNDSQNNRNVGQFTPSDPDSGVEFEENTVGGSSERVHANGSLCHSPYLHPSQSNFPSQPDSYEAAITPHPEQDHYATVQRLGQSEPYPDRQHATGYATGCDGEHNKDTVYRQPDRCPDSLSMQHFVPSAIRGTSEYAHTYSRSCESFVSNSMNQVWTTGTNGYEDNTHSLQPSHYRSHAPQADPRQPSQHERYTLSSSDGPWSPQNPRCSRPPLTMELTAIDDQRRLGDSDAYSSVRTDSQIFSNASSDGGQWTTDSSVEDMSGSTATIRLSQQIASSREMFRIDIFEPHPPRARTASSMSESLHSGYDQDIETHNHFGPGSGTRPIFSASSAPYLGVPQQQQQVDSVYSSPASAPSPSLPGTIECDNPLCRKKYSGQYRKGNRSRHMRLKHGILEQAYNCEAEGCEKSFKRQDARLKHYRKHHPEFSPGPALTRKAHQSEQEHYLRGMS